MTEIELGSCKHFTQYKKDFSVRSFTLVHGCFSACVSKEARKRKALSCLCFICGSSGPQLYSCLHCIFFGCKGAHINEHLRNSVHYIALELSYGTLYCYACQDFIYDNECLKISEDHLRLEAKSLNRPLPWRPCIPSQQEVNILLENPRTYVLSFNSVGLRGLSNLGATCFMNCIIQVLVHTPLLRDYFSNGLPEKDSCNNSINSNRECMVCEFSRLFQEFYSSESDPLPLNHLLYLVWKHAKHLAGYAHKDAHEFFIAFLDLLHIHRHQSKTQQHDPIADSNEIYPTKCNCIICKIFTGSLQSDVVCTECHGVSTTIDPFWDISLDLGEAQTGTPRTLIECLERYTKAENLGSNAKIKCSNCKCYQESTKKLSMRSLPTVASFHLKRFEYSSLESRKKKYSISFPKELDMTPFMSQKQEDFQGDYRYLLYAVVNHTGTTEYGHYTSYIRHIKDVWVKCNDDIITSASIEQVLNSEGYLLFYHKKKLDYDT
ncbi:ubiquitin carboxyl-terminal hydrolase nonstop [Condylostylus longicornis]|uniref:ubiquitin carboxyl-terminal hydrolase nonstop n=1 Tax=Condylostylus longicornis TaxID=2530218 RepID=UPI00244E0DE0|nr:ubiquitin carboxyl-terminal hydrolase nonstop [Condylostylus longicornis]XP_055385637.1 ubiquitin carboxyl-terminal hydrolase nonstop [Condylostylus longicornis]